MSAQPAIQVAQYCYFISDMVFGVLQYNPNENLSFKEILTEIEVVFQLDTKSMLSVESNLAQSIQHHLVNTITIARGLELGQTHPKYCLRNIPKYENLDVPITAKIHYADKPTLNRIEVMIQKRRLNLLEET